MKKYYYRISGKIAGPFSAKEMMDLNLPNNTPVTDNPALKNEEWKKAGDFDFAEIDRIDQSTSNKYQYIKIENGQYLFFFKKNEKEYGPRSARKMAKLNLPSETPVREASMGGVWATAGDFDFISLSKEEEELQSVANGINDKDLIIGVILLIIGIITAFVKYSNSIEGRDSFIYGCAAILFGLTSLIKGLLGGNAKEGEQYVYEEGVNENVDDKRAPDNLSQQQLFELYAELELTPTATNEEVIKKYRILAKRYHPDRYGNMDNEEKQAATARFRSLNEAYRLIKQLRNMK